MTRSILRIYVVAFLLLVPSVVRGQESTASPIIAIEGLPTVFVLDDQGAEYRGKLIRVDADELVMRVNATERTFKRDAIRRVQKRGDSLKNGAIIGALTGAGLGALSGAFAGCPDCIGVALLSVGIYTAIGVGLDAAIQGRTLLYEASAGTPKIQPGGITALAFSIRW